MQGWEVDLSNTDVLGLATVFRRGRREMLPGVSPRSSTISRKLLASQQNMICSKKQKNVFCSARNPRRGFRSQIGSESQEILLSVRLIS